MNPLDTFPRTFDHKNIIPSINKYIKLLSEVKLTINESNLLKFLNKIKRTKINQGPYPNVTLFEASNRIMTDLVILFGIKILLNGKIPEFSFSEYIVDLGNENNNSNDIIAKDGNKSLIGEAFNVAPSFFQNKKTKMLKKLRNKSEKNTYLIIMCNSDATNLDYKPQLRENEFFLSVDINF